MEGDRTSRGGIAQLSDSRQADGSTIINDDCIDGMRSLDDGSVDLIVTDPPFAIGFGARRSNYNRRPDNVLDGYGEIRQRDYLSFSRSWISEAYGVLRESGSMFVFSGWSNLKDVLIALDEAGFITVNHIIWRYQFGVVTKKRYVTSHYHCLYVCKDDKKRRFYPDSRFGPGSERYRDMEDVWYIRREYWRNEKKTPTKLPSEIIRKILQYASRPGDLVLDPFLGSGQVAAVSKEMGRCYLGFEIIREYFDFAKRHIGKTRAQETSGSRS